MTGRTPGLQRPARLRRAIAIAAGITLGLTGPNAAAAQSSELTGIESLIISGRLTEARTRLEVWRNAHPPGEPGVQGDDRAFALLLEGRLATDPDSALSAYRSLALGYSGSRFAAEALLRVGQAMTIADSLETAIRFLRRLDSEHPTSPHRATANLWLMRALARSGDTAAACAIAADRLAEADDAMGALTLAMRTEAQTVGCPAPDTQPRGSAQRDPARAGAVATRARTDTVSTGQRADAEPLPFAVQAAAMLNPNNITALAARLDAAGFDTRLVHVDGGQLVRIRIGRFASEAEAEALAEQVRSAGFEAVVVDDALRESPARGGRA